MTIAHFSYVKMAFWLVFGLAIAIFPWLLLFTSLGLSIHDHYSGQPLAHSWFTWFFAALSLLVFWKIVAAGRPLFIERGRAVWVSDGRLWYPSLLHGSGGIRSVPLADIAGVSEGRYWGVVLFRNIAVQLKTPENVDYLASYLLAEPRHIVLGRINDALAAAR